jgi:hypothetical protein
VIAVDRARLVDSPPYVSELARTAGGGGLPLPRAQHHLGARQRSRPDVVHVQMREDVVANRARIDPGLAQASLEAISVGGVEAHGELHVDVPPRLGEVGVLAGVDDDGSLRMLDREAPDREPLGPLPVGERRGEAQGGSFSHGAPVRLA